MTSALGTHGHDPFGTPITDPETLALAGSLMAAGLTEEQAEYAVTYRRNREIPAIICRAKKIAAVRNYPIDYVLWRMIESNSEIPILEV